MPKVLTLAASRSSRLLIALGSIAFLIPASILIGEIMKTGNPRLAIASLQGHRVYPLNPALRVDFSGPGERKKTNYQVANLTGGIVNIVGFSCSCTCMIVNGLPCTIKPYQSQTFDVTIAAADEEEFGGAIEIYTDDEQNRILQLTFTGHVARRK